VTRPSNPSGGVFGGIHMSTSEATPRVAREEVAQHGARESMWPRAVIVVGVGLTIAWIGLLGFGLIKLIQFAI
jgi:hypothetical protein